MSAVAAGFLDQWGEARYGRWLVSLMLVLALHVCAALIFAFHQVQPMPPVPADEPVLLDLAPPAEPPPAPAKLVAPVPSSEGNASLGAAKSTTTQLQLPLTPAPSLPATPQARLQVDQLPPPETPPTQAPVAEPVPVAPSAPSPAVAEAPRFLVPPPPVIVAEAAVPAPTASKPTPQPAAGMNVLPQPNAQEDPLSAWQREVLTKLNRLKTWPHDAVVNKETGTVDVTFLVDRQGHIVYFKITRRSPFDSLNHAVRTLMRKADPLPPPPPPKIDLGQPQQFTITLDFS